MGAARASAVVEVGADRAFDAWTDPRRWAAFIDGFRRVVSLDDGWPSPGSALVWDSVESGRGRVREEVVACERPARFQTKVFEESLEGTQTLTFEERDGSSAVTLELDYRLSRGGPLRGITDFIFIRRAQADAIARTLRRFAAEANAPPGL